MNFYAACVTREDAILAATEAKRWYPRASITDESNGRITLTELVRIDQFAEFEANMKAFRERYDGVVYDLDDPNQNRQARSDRLAIGKVISKLDKSHKELKAPLLEQVKIVDGERKRIKDSLLDIQGKIKVQIEQHEARIEAEKQRVQALIDHITGLAEFDFEPDSSLITAHLADLEAINPEAEEYAPRQADATLAHRQVSRTLETILAARVKYEAEQAELERLRAEEEARKRAEHEERIRKEAAERERRIAEENARKQAEAAKRREQAIEEEKRRAERRAKEVEEKRKAEAEAARRREAEMKKRAEQEAKDAAERAIQEERRRVEEAWKKKEEKRKADEAKAARKAANKRHRAQVRQMALEDLARVCSEAQSATGWTTEQLAEAIFKAAVSGEIRHINVYF